MYEKLKNWKNLLISLSSTTACYIGNLITNYDFSIIGHFLMGVATKEIGSSIYYYVNKGSKISYEISSIISLNTLFQVLKYYNLNPLPNVGNEFEIPSIIYGITAGFLAIYYEKFSNKQTS